MAAAWGNLGPPPTLGRPQQGPSEPRTPPARGHRAPRSPLSPLRDRAGCGTGFVSREAPGERPGSDGCSRPSVQTARCRRQPRRPSRAPAARRWAPLPAPLPVTRPPQPRSVPGRGGSARSAPVRPAGAARPALRRSPGPPALFPPGATVSAPGAPRAARLLPCAPVRPGPSVLPGAPRSLSTPRSFRAPRCLRAPRSSRLGSLPCAPLLYRPARAPRSLRAPRGRAHPC